MPTASLRRPGGDLARLPIGFDLRALDVAEGVRAALACAVIIIANEWIAWPPLVYMALGANLTCFCDVGGPIRSRIPGLLAFTFAGAAIWSVFGVLRPLGIPLVVPLACAVIFCNAYLRIYGQAAAAIGNVLTVVLVFGLDVPLSPQKAGVVGLMFLAGGLWCTFLALVLWRLYPARHSRVAVAEVWEMLGDLAADLHALTLRDDVQPRDWEIHARAHRRAVRDAIERARIRVLELARGRAQVGRRAAQASLRLETADQLFGVLIALSDLLEQSPSPGTRGAAGHMLDRLQIMLRGIAGDILRDRDERGPRLDQAIRDLSDTAGGDPLLSGLAGAIADRLRIMLALSGPEGAQRSGGTLSGEAAVPFLDRALGPIRANLTWRSVTMRHAVRTAAISAPALVVTLSYETNFTHWLPYTVVLVMQPFFAATWQRALERIGGTVAGAVLGGLLAMLAHTPLALAALMFPLCVLGFAARQVSYGAYIACLTPQIVVLVELVEPGHSSLEVAAMRTLFTLIGGLIAVAGSLLLWPSWEPDRLPAELVRSIRAHAAYARAALTPTRAATSPRTAGDAGPPTTAAAQGPGATKDPAEAATRAPAAISPFAVSPVAGASPLATTSPTSTASPATAASSTVALSATADTMAEPDVPAGLDAPATAEGPRAAEAASIGAAPAAFAAADAMAGDREVVLAAARREAGLASNNLEAAISRALQEPRRRNRDRVEAAMVVDAALRRLAARLIALHHDPRAHQPGRTEAWAEWLPAALDAVAGRTPLPARPESGPEPLLRIARQVELMDGALRRT